MTSKPDRRRDNLLGWPLLCSATLYCALQVGDRVRMVTAFKHLARKGPLHQETTGTILRRKDSHLEIQWDDGRISRCVNIANLERIPPDPILPRKTSPRVEVKGILTEAEIGRFQSIQELLTALGYKDDQTMRSMIHTRTQHVIGFDDIASRALPEFVRWGLRTGWLSAYLKEEGSPPEKRGKMYEPYSRMTHRLAFERD